MILFVDRKDEAITAIHKLFLLIYFLMIFEGVLRKWFFPSMSSAIFFIKDPFVLMIYIYAIQARLFYKCLAYYFYIFVFVLIVLQAVVYIFINPDQLVIYLYGLRNYLFYMPLIFVGAKCLDINQVKRIAVLTMKVSIFICGLVMLQYVSPPSSVVNKGLSSEGFVFLVAEGVVRPYGVFTFTMGHVLFVGSLFSFTVALYFNVLKVSSKLFQKHIYLFIYLSSFLAMFFTTGSRSIYAYSALTLFFVTAGNLLLPNKFITKRLLIVAPVIVLVLFIFSFTETFQLVVERNISAINSEGSPFVRILKSLFSFVNYFNETPIFGYGVGSGTNAASVLLRGASEQGMGFLLAEDEWSRIVLELGYLIGGIYILFRIYLVLWMLKVASVAFKQGNYFPMILFGFIGSVVLNGVMTMQGTVLAYGVLFSSFLLGSALAPIKNNYGLRR